MIPRRQWYAILRSRRVGNAPVGITRLGQRIVLWRDAAGRVVCLPDRCCHRAAQLSRGRVREGCLECPYHGMRYAADGRVVKVPALGARPIPQVLHVTPLVCREERGLVWLWHGPDEPVLPPVPWDDALDAELRPQRHATDFEDEFDVSYLRVMENSTDLFHVPFVHRRTIPIGEILEDFECTAEGPHIRVSGRMTNGRTVGVAATVHVIAPSLLLLSFGTKVRFVAVATPIDESHTWLFARYVQDYVKLPVLGRLASWLLGALDYRLLQRHQDLPVWRSQQLAAPDDISDYHLIKGDGGVAAYFRAHRILSGARDDR